MKGAPRRILITGCSSGIGYGVARALREQGWNVYATCRKPDDCARLRAEGFDSFTLDYDAPDSLSDAVREVENRGGVDVLYNNGAFALPGAVEDLPRDALRAVFETNVFGLHDLTRRVIPLMRAQGHGRVINCSSVFGFAPAKWRGAYVASKYALEGLTETLRLEMADTPIKVILIQPGPIRSDIRTKSRAPFEMYIDWENSARADQYRDTLLKRLYEPSAPGFLERSPEDVARVIGRALAAKHPRARYKVTAPTVAMAALKRALPPRALDWVLAKG